MTKIQQLISQSQEDCMGVKQTNPNTLVTQTIGECVLAILATDCRSITYTTYDKAMVDGVISRVVDNVRNHFNVSGLG